MPEGSGIQLTADSATDKPRAVRGEATTVQAFISYASADRAIADAICAALERDGVKCWIAPRDVTPGELYSANIVHAIDATRVLVLVLSQHAADSAHVVKEVERASSKLHRILSFRIDQAPLPDGLEYFLNTSQWLDASATGAERALPRLVDAVKSALGKPVVPAPVNDSPPVAVRAGWRSHRMLQTFAVFMAVALAYVGVDRLWLSKRDDPQAALVGATTSSPPESLPAMSTASANTIAVLPFVNMSSDKEQEYFSDGLSEELLNLLAKVSELRVAARTSSFYYKDKDVKLMDVARELQVAHLLEGSVRKSGDRVRITAQLIRAADGYHQWSETYDRTLEDVFAVQEEIAAAVVSQLKITLLSDAPSVHRTTPEAYALYLQAVQLDRRGTDRFEESIALYRQSLAIDPDYPPAWFGLFLNYLGQAGSDQITLADAEEKARDALRKALAIDPEYSLAHAGLGWIELFYENDLAAAARYFDRALALNPTDIYTLGIASSLTGVLDGLEAEIPLLEYLVSRDPMDPFIHAGLASTYFYAGRLEESVASSRAALKLSPEMFGPHELIGDALFLKRDYKAAMVEYEKDPAVTAHLWGRAAIFHIEGKRSASDAAINELIEKHSNWGVYIAILFALRGDNDRAFEWLQKAIDSRDSSLATVHHNLWLNSLHKDRRWLPFLRKIGKSPEQLAAIKFELKVPRH